MAKKILLLKTGTTYSDIRQQFGDFDVWFSRALHSCDVNVVDAVTETDSPDWLAHDGIIITGSPAMVTEQEPWSERLADWLASYAHGQLPILGVCYGHQLLAHALGGTVDWHPRGREIGTVEIDLTSSGRQDTLLEVLPPTFLGHVTHAQSVTHLPPAATLLASNDFEPHHGFRVGESTWGVQFHPEFNPAIMQAYLKQSQSTLEREGRDVNALMDQVTEADANGGLLRRFVTLL